jgi:La-related protein 7
VLPDRNFSISDCFLSMAQETSSSDQKTLEASAEPELTRTGSSSRLNVKAPEFVPCTSDRVVVPIHHHLHPIHIFHPASPRAAYYGAATSQFEYYGISVKNVVVTSQVEPDLNPPQPVAGKERSDSLSDDVIQQITKQLATALRTSSKLVVSDDGKKVKCQLHFTEADMEEL